MRWLVASEVVEVVVEVAVGVAGRAYRRNSTRRHSSSVGAVATHRLKLLVPSLYSEKNRSSPPTHADGSNPVGDTVGEGVFGVGTGVSVGETVGTGTGGRLGATVGGRVGACVGMGVGTFAAYRAMPCAEAEVDVDTSSLALVPEARFCSAMRYTSNETSRSVCTQYT